MKKDRYQELGEIWFKRAQDDYLWAKDSFETGHFGSVCFICQQIAEKTLKAYLFFKREKLVRTHNLEQLLKLCSKYEPDFNKLSSKGKILNKYYTDTRYPDIWDYSRFDNQKLAKEALKKAEEILKFVGGKLTNILSLP